MCFPRFVVEPYCAIAPGTANGHLLHGGDRNFKDEPGFTRVVSIGEIRAKDGNLSIPLYVGGETQAQTDAATESATTALPDALSAWL